MNKDNFCYDAFSDNVMNLYLELTKIWAIGIDQKISDTAPIRAASVVASPPISRGASRAASKEEPVCRAAKHRTGSGVRPNMNIALPAKDGARNVGAVNVAALLCTACIVAVAVLLPRSACANSLGEGDVVGASRMDPLESVNRGSYALNHALDRTLIRPIAVTYNRIIPRPIRLGVSNVISNLGEPVVAVNDLAQLQPAQALKTSVRFAGNTTFGIFGIFDVAASNGLPHHDNGFAVTLGKCGVPSGPYLYIPIAGPSSLRDAVGTAVDVITDPLRFIRHARTKAIERAQLVLTAVSTRAMMDDDLRELERTSTDPYATLRSVYLQRMQAEIEGDDDLLANAPNIDGALNATPPPAADPKQREPKP